MFETLMRNALKNCARSGIAPGYVYQAVEKYGQYFSAGALQSELLFDIKMVLNLKDHIARQIYYFGAYEPIDAYLLLKLTTPGDIFVDAGANIGFYSLLMSKHVGPNGHIHSFEPVQKNFHTLQKNINLSQSQNNMSLINKALWDKEEVISLSRDKEVHQNDGQYTAGHVDKTEPDETIECQTIKLDDYVEQKNLSKVDFIKMDIEGSELKALTGSLVTIDRHRPIILLEVCRETCQRFGYTPKELWNLLKPFGYKIWSSGTSNRTSKRLENFDDINQKNVFLYTGELPDVFTDEWSYKSIKRKFASL